MINRNLGYHTFYTSNLALKIDSKTWQQRLTIMYNECLLPVGGCGRVRFKEAVFKKKTKKKHQFQVAWNSVRTPRVIVTNLLWMYKFFAILAVNKPPPPNPRKKRKEKKKKPGNWFSTLYNNNHFFTKIDTHEYVHLIEFQKNYQQHRFIFLQF